MTPEQADRLLSILSSIDDSIRGVGFALTFMLLLFLIALILKKV